MRRARRRGSSMARTIGLGLGGDRYFRRGWQVSGRHAPGPGRLRRTTVVLGLRLWRSEQPQRSGRRSAERRCRSLQAIRHRDAGRALHAGVSEASLKALPGDAPVEAAWTTASSRSTRDLVRSSADVERRDFPCNVSASEYMFAVGMKGVHYVAWCVAHSARVSRRAGAPLTITASRRIPDDR